MLFKYVCVALFAVACFPAVRGGPEELGIASSVIGLVASTLGIVSTIMGFVRQFGAKHQAVVRIVAGKGNNIHSHFNGAPPSVVLWDVNGKRLGYDHKHGHKVPEGNFRDIHVVTHKTNERAEYIMLVAQKKHPICISAVYISHPDEEVKDSLTGDIPRMCGSKWGHSTNRVGPSHQVPACFWINSSHKKKGNKIDDKPDGISWHLPSFVGSKGRAKQYTEHNETMCKVPARLQMHENLQGNLKHYRIPIFDTRPLFVSKDQTDGDIEAFMKGPTSMSRPVNHDLTHHTKRQELTSKCQKSTSKSRLLTHMQLKRRRRPKWLVGVTR